MFSSRTRCCLVGHAVAFAVAAAFTILSLLSPVGIFGSSAKNADSASNPRAFSLESIGKIRGVNLGGWLVLEPFIAPALFQEQRARDPAVVDEYTLCASLGRENCKRALRTHYETFVTEDDFAQIGALGLNFVRIPVGYWAFKDELGLQGDEHDVYISDSREFLHKAVGWASDHGLWVYLDLHSAPGAQNQWNHAGRENYFKWNDPAQIQRHLNDTLRTLDAMAREFLPSKTVSARMSSSVVLIGVVNEPRIDMFQGEHRARVGRFIADAYSAITAVRSDYFVVVGDGFLGNNVFEFLEGVFGMGRLADKEQLIVDTHKYMIFDDYLISMSHAQKLAYVKQQYAADVAFAADKHNFTRVITGEFSIADTDCGQFVNSVQDGARGMRYRRLQGDNPRACAAIEDPRAWTREYRAFLRELAARQTAAFEAGLGWVYWTWKTAGGVNAHWDYALAARERVVPALEQ